MINHRGQGRLSASYLMIPLILIYEHKNGCGKGEHYFGGRPLHLTFIFNSCRYYERLTGVLCTSTMYHDGQKGFMRAGSIVQ